MKSLPNGSSLGRTIIPSCSSEIFNSRSEQIIPLDSTPRILAFLIFRFPGRIEPTVANGINCPESTFGAPQIT